MPKVDVLKMPGVVAIVLVLAYVGYCTYRWNNRPPQTVITNEYKTYQMSGQNATVNDYPKPEKQKVNGFLLGGDTDKHLIVSFIHMF